MQKIISGLLLLCFSASAAFTQINPENIEIIRDKWGVPHIYAPTDVEVAYGLAWATAEDDFKTVQEQLLPIKGLMGSVQGKDGAIADILVQMLEIDSLVEARYDSDLSPQFKKVAEAYVAGANAYARAYPEEVLHKDLFPVTAKDLVAGHVLGAGLLTSIQSPFTKVLSGSITNDEIPRGSNAFAISRRKSKEDQTYLAINSHQPLEGPASWYEIHLVSEEGTNILGATFAGGVAVFHGANEHLGWAHTVNHPDFNDVFKLTMHPDKKDTYKFDGEWLKLEKKKAKTKVKLGPIKISVSRAYYISKYGLTLENDNGFYAIAVAANRNIKQAEQWYWMNKATNLEEFRKALDLQGIPGTNIVYADKEDNIFYVSNSRLPKRNPNYDWTKVLPGDTSATLWSDEYYPLDSLPLYLNPESGYVYNTNHSPFYATGDKDNLKPTDVNKTLGHPHVNNNRSLRFKELIDQYDKLDYEDFKRIKYDQFYGDKLYDNRIVNLHGLMEVDASKYPDLTETLKVFHNWDHKTDTTSEGASIFILAIRKLTSLMRARNAYKNWGKGNEEEFVAALRFARDHLLEHFGTVKVPFGKLQRHVRGNVSLAIGGGPEILAAMYSGPWENGRYRSRAGDSYISLVRFTEEGVLLETVNAYGASAKESSPHYTDQMQMFVRHERKTMTLDIDKVRKEAERIYHPRK
ncbi:MAG: penicillin acylase family protein [Bacteroidia bacterium]|nr:penicillin acylase family protein [Bacteroidia bacterium]